MLVPGSGVFTVHTRGVGEDDVGILTVLCVQVRTVFLYLLG